MSGLSEWLDSCFDQADERAPVRAFVFGATLSSMAAGISSVAVDPTDWRMLLSMLAGFAFFGGGCGAMFALPPEKFGHLCSFGFELFGFLPLKVFLGIGLFPFALFAFSFFVAILAAVAALGVLYRVARSVVTCVLWPPESGSRRRRMYHVSSSRRTRF